MIGSAIESGKVIVKTVGNIVGSVLKSTKDNIEKYQNNQKLKNEILEESKSFQYLNDEGRKNFIKKILLSQFLNVDEKINLLQKCISNLNKYEDKKNLLESDYVKDFLSVNKIYSDPKKRNDFFAGHVKYVLESKLIFEDKAKIVFLLNEFSKCEDLYAKKTLLKLDEVVDFLNPLLPEVKIDFAQKIVPQIDCPDYKKEFTASLFDNQDQPKENRIINLNSLDDPKNYNSWTKFVQETQHKKSPQEITQRKI